MTDETQASEVKCDTRGWAGTVFMAALAVILAVLFVFPGFVAAGFEKAGVSMWVINGTWEVGEPGKTASKTEAQIARWMLYPAFKLMEHSSLAYKFYTWEFQLAGGFAFDIDV